MEQNKNFFGYIFGDKKLDLSFEKLMIIAAFAYPVTGIPQLLQVLQGNIAGVSIASWAGFAFFVALFLVYSIKKRVKPMIITYSIWLAIDLMVVWGVLLKS